MEHLNKRGVLTMYWVLNEDDEILAAVKDCSMAVIMTDRPRHVQSILRDCKKKSKKNN